MKKMGLPKVGMITFSDAREHEYKVLYEEKTAARIKRTVEYFADYEMELHTFDTVARSPQDIDRQTDELKKKGVEVFIANIPCWTWPNGVVRGVLNMGRNPWNRRIPGLRRSVKPDRLQTSSDTAGFYG